MAKLAVGAAAKAVHAAGLVHSKHVIWVLG